MKFIKKRILALLVCICMLCCTLSGCSLVVTDKSKSLKSDAMKIGSTVLTQQEVVDLWYSFYSENSSYFYYYSESAILDIFYKNVITKYAVMAEVEKLKTEGKLFYTESDDAAVWKQVFDYVAKSLNTNETSLYTQQGVEDSDLPKRLQSESKEEYKGETSYLYEEYTFAGMDDYECDYLTGPNVSYSVGKEVSSTTVNTMIEALKTYLFKVPAETSEEDDEDDKKYATLNALINEINGLEDIKNNDKLAEKDTRQTAYDMYIGNLLLTSKADGTNYNKVSALYNEIKRVYESYYETYIYNMYSSYIKSLVTDSNSEYYSLNDQAIVLRYLQLLGKDMQNYTVEENYIAVVEAKATNTVLLYHYEGQNYYFSVQHLLVGFTDEITEFLSTVPGYDAGSDSMFESTYKIIRENYFNQLGLSGWTEYKNVIYRDDEGFSVYYLSESNSEDGVEHYIYFDKTATPETSDDEDVDTDTLKSCYYYLNNENQKVYITNRTFAKCTEATVTVDVMLNDFQTTYNKTLEILENNKSAEVDTIKTLLTENADVKYVISSDFINDYKKADTEESIKLIKNKIFSNIFMQHTFKYSSDAASLGNELSNYVGMIISSGKDNHTVGGSEYVADFTDGARKLLEAYINNGYTNTQLSEDNMIISNYGLHFVVINDVYGGNGKGNQAITGDTITYNNIFKNLDGSEKTEEEIAAGIQQAIDIMQNTYITTSSSQTIYQYIFEKVRDELIGSSGTVFTQVRDKLYNEYVAKEGSEDYLVYYSKLSYSELMAALS